MEVEQEVARLLLVGVKHAILELVEQRIGRAKEDKALQFEHIQPVALTLQQLAIQVGALDGALVVRAGQGKPNDVDAAVVDHKQDHRQRDAQHHARQEAEKEDRAEDEDDDQIILAGKLV